MNPFITGALAGYGIAIPVGAIAVLIVQQGIRRGLRPAIVAGAGAATADLVYATVAVVGGAALGTVVESWQTGFQLASAITLIAIAVFGLLSMRSANRPLEASPALQQPTLRTIYSRFFALTIVNPATVAYFIAIVVGLGLATNLTPREGALFVAGAFTASLSWQSLLAVIGATAGRRLSTRANTGAIIAGNVLILGFALAILLRLATAD
ncbi:MAG: LysE family translocator [Acidimicrobiia bacterium]|nr:LysE family translocator [Acidimicrobiia bacterium]MDH5421505.1 LysE family translocator [Acidimicrobiia bacterium]MDH5504707.1 LysE family translocator [Acidimicrobiia bacterium]